jgi:hypothetical protein
MSTPTFKITSDNFNLANQINNNDFKEITNTLEKNYMCFVKESDLLTHSPSQLNNNCLNKLIKDNISFQLYNQQYVNGVEIPSIKSDSWGMYSQLFSKGFLLMSVEQVSVVSNSNNNLKTFTYRVYNNKLGNDYVLNMPSLSTLLLYNGTFDDFNPAQFTADCNIYDAAGIKINSGIKSINPVNNLRYQYINDMNITVPNGGYMEFKLQRKNVVQAVNVYLLVGFRGVTVAKPLINFTRSSITSDYENQPANVVKAMITPNIKNDSLLGAVINFTDNTTGVNLDNNQFKVQADNSVTLVLNSRQLAAIGSAHNISAVYNEQLYLDGSSNKTKFPNYISSDVTSYLSYTITKHSLQTKIISINKTKDVNDIHNISFVDSLIVKIQVSDASNRDYENTLNGLMEAKIMNVDDNSTYKTLYLSYSDADKAYIADVNPKALNIRPGINLKVVAQFWPSQSSNLISSNYNEPATPTDFVFFKVSSFEINGSVSKSQIGFTETTVVTAYVTDSLNYDKFSQDDVPGVINLGLNGPSGSESLPMVYNPLTREYTLSITPKNGFASFSSIINGEYTINAGFECSFRIDSFRLLANKSLGLLTVSIINLDIVISTISVEYRGDITVSAKPVSNGKTLTYNDIHGDVYFNITYVDKNGANASVDILPNDITRADLSSDIYTKTFKPADYQLNAITEFTIRAHCDSNSVANYTIFNSESKKFNVTPQTTTLAIDRPQDGFSVYNTDIINRDKDVLADSSNIIFEYGFNKPFSITGSLNDFGGNQDGVFRLYSLQSETDTVGVLFPNVLDVYENTPDIAKFKFDIPSPSALEIVKGSSMWIMVKWESATDLFKNSTAVSKVISLRMYTRFDPQFDCVLDTNLDTFEHTFNLSGKVIEYKTVGDDTPASQVYGKYTVQYRLATSNVFVDFGDSYVDDATDYGMTLPFTQNTPGNFFVRLAFEPGSLAADNTFLPNDNYQSVYSIPKQITITKASIRAASLELESEGLPVSVFDYDTIVRFKFSEIKTPFGIKVPGKANFTFDGKLIGSDIQVLASDNGIKYTSLFSALERAINVGTNKIINVVFTPDDLVRYEILNINGLSLINVLQSTAKPAVSNLAFDNNTPTYLNTINLTCNIGLFRDSTGAMIPYNGTFKLFHSNNLLSPIYQKTLSITDESQILLFNGKPKDLGLLYKEHSLVAKFYSNDSNVRVISQDLTLSVRKQTIPSVSITTTNSEIFYDTLFDLTANIIEDVKGSVNFYVLMPDSQSVALGSAVIDIDSVTGKATGIATLRNINLYTKSLLAGDSNNSFSSYTVSADFISNDDNYADGQSSRNNLLINIKKVGVKIHQLNIDGESQSVNSAAYLYGVNKTILEQLHVTGVMKTVNGCDVTSGIVYVRFSYMDGGVLKLYNYGNTSVGLDGVFSLTIPISVSGGISATGPVYLAYQATNNFVNKDLIAGESGYSQTDIPGEYFINVSNLEFNMTMSQNIPISDYHDGIFQFNAVIDRALNASALAYNQIVAQNYVNSGSSSDAAKGQIVFLIIKNVGNLPYTVYKKEVNPIVDTIENKTTASWTFNPKTLANVNGSDRGLQKGDYTLKCYFEGIDYYYDSKDAIFVDINNQPSNSINFTVIASTPVIKYTLLDPVVDYRRRPLLDIKIQSPQTIEAPYSQANDIRGMLVLHYLNDNDQQFNLLITDMKSGQNGIVLSDSNQIKDIVNTITVKLPIINAGNVKLLRGSFFPTDTTNYNSKTTDVAYKVNKYKPILENIKIAVKTVLDDATKPEFIDAAPATNVDDLLYTRSLGFINYDERFIITNSIHDNDGFGTSYDGIQGTMIYSYVRISDPSSIVNGLLPNNQLVRSGAYDNSNYLNWYAVVEKQKINFVNADDQNDYTLSVKFIPYDLANYLESEIITDNFSIYIANALGELKLQVLNNTTVKYNLNLQSTIEADIKFNDNVDVSTGNLRLYYDVQGTLDNTTNLIKPSKIANNSEGVISVHKNTALYTLTFSTAAPNALLTARLAPYIIYGRFTPDSTNYPTVKQTTPKQLQINPSLVLTKDIDNVQYGDVESPLTFFATMYTGNDSYNGGSVVFKIQHKTKNILYTITKPFVNNVAKFMSNETDSNGNPLFNFVIGTYTITAVATFENDGVKLYNSVVEDSSMDFTITKRTVPFNIALDDNNILYKELRPTITVTYKDLAYDGVLTYTITNIDIPLSPIVIVQNNPNATYAQRSHVSKYQLDRDLVVGKYTINAHYESENFEANAKFIISLAVNKNNVAINPLSLYKYVNDSFTLSATLNNPAIIDSTISFIITKFNYKYDANYNANGSYETLPISIFANSLNAGTYEVAAYYNGNANYNKSPVVFTNIVIGRKLQTTTLSFVEYKDYKYTVSLTNTMTNDDILLYNLFNKEPIAMFKANAANTYSISDLILITGANDLYAVVSNVNYSAKSNMITINRIKQNLISVNTVSNVVADTQDGLFRVKFDKPIVLTSTISDARSSVISEGQIMFYANDSILGSAPIVNNKAELTVKLFEMGVNVVKTQFANSANYNDFSTGNTVSITVVKDDLSAEIRDESVNNNSKNQVKIIKTYVGPALVDSASLGIHNHINFGTVTVFNGLNKIYDNVPVVNGVATFELFLDEDSYSLKSIFNSNEFFNGTESNILTLTIGKRDVAFAYKDFTKTVLFSNNLVQVDVSITFNSVEYDNYLASNSGYFEFSFGSDKVTIQNKNNSGRAFFVSLDPEANPVVKYFNDYLTGELLAVKSA